MREFLSNKATEETEIIHIKGLLKGGMDTMNMVQGRI